jgi:hypothetical protein
MRLSLSKATLNLDRLQIVSLRGARGTRLTCGKGMLWVTQEGIARDDFLAAGCGVAVETDGTVLIEALSASSATLEQGEAAEPSTAIELALA